MHHLLYRLRAFPHVVNRVEIQWGSRECRDYIFSLTIEDDTRVHRRGFPFDALNTLVELLTLHDYYYPFFVPIIKNWEQSRF